MQEARNRAGTLTAPDDLRDQLRDLVTREGTRVAAEAVGASPESVARMVAGLPVRRGTVAQARAALAPKAAA